MSPGILGKKIGMTQVFRADGQVVPVTVLKAGPCIVTQRKTPATDGYDAVQLGLMEYAKASRMTKPAVGHLKKAGAEGVKFTREFRLDRVPSQGDLKAGDRVLADEFKPKEKVDVIGVSKGRGFAGVVRRHHFRGSDDTHGSMFHRAPGSGGLEAMSTETSTMITRAADLYVTKCAKCHRFYDPLPYPAPEWNRWMTKMSRKAKLTEDEAKLLGRYLAAFRTDRKSTRLNSSH